MAWDDIQRERALTELNAAHRGLMDVLLPGYEDPADIESDERPAPTVYDVDEVVGAAFELLKAVGATLPLLDDSHRWSRFD